jgi:small subunit ribosomal protein S6
VKEYEIVYIVKPDLSEEEHTGKVERVHNLIVENGGEVDESKDWGKRLLAYEIKRYSEGHYRMTVFRSPPGSLSELEGRLNLDEDILRYQIVARAS